MCFYFKVFHRNEQNRKSWTLSGFNAAAVHLQGRKGRAEDGEQVKRWKMGKTGERMEDGRIKAPVGVVFL